MIRPVRFSARARSQATRVARFEVFGGRVLTERNISYPKKLSRIDLAYLKSENALSLSSAGAQNLSYFFPD